MVHKVSLVLLYDSLGPNFILHVIIVYIAHALYAISQSCPRPIFGAKSSHPCRQKVYSGASLGAIATIGQPWKTPCVVYVHVHTYMFISMRQHEHLHAYTPILHSIALKFGTSECWSYKFFQPTCALYMHTLCIIIFRHRQIHTTYLSQTQNCTRSLNKIFYCIILLHTRTFTREK